MSDRLLLFVAGALALVSLGLPWGATGSSIDGVEHQMRVLGATGALAVGIGVRASRRRLVVGGLLVAALALPMGLSQGTGTGRIAYGLALGLVALTLLRPPAPSTST